MTFTLLTSRKRDHAAGLDVVLTQAAGDASAAPRARLRARTDQGGWFRIDLPAGSYELRAEHPAHGWLRQGVRGLAHTAFAAS